MQLRFIKSSSLLILVFSLIATGCLKDKPFDNGEIQSLHGSNVKVISLGISVSQSPNFVQYAYSNSNNDTTVNLVPVELGGPSDAPQDIHVTVVQQDTLVNAYNNDSANMANGNFLQIPASSQFSIVNPGGVVTIPKGSRVGYLQIKFVPSALIGLTYGIGFGISKVAEAGYTVSGNVGTGIVALLIKNAYDGKYTLNELTTGWAAYNIADGTEYTWPTPVIFATTGANSNQIVTQEGGNAQVGFTPSGGIASFGAATPQYNFDATSNKLTSITNLTPDARNRAFTPNPAVNSRFDASTHNVILGYKMTQNGRPTQFVYDTLVYIGPR
jgi:hypothetical protein